MVARAFAALLFGLVAARSPSARADGESDRVEAARASFDHGTELAAEGRFAEAERAFRSSLELVTRPNTQYNLAVVLYRQQRFAECLRVLDAFLLRTDPVRDAPIRANAEALHGLAASRASRVVLRVAPVTAVVAGAEFAGHGAERSAYLDPGAQRVSVSAPLHYGRSVLIDARPGGSQVIAVALEREAHPEARASAASREHASASPWPWALTIGGGALLAGAAVTGLLALDADREVTAACKPGGAPCEQTGLRSTQARAQTLATATDVLWITGALSACVGVGWLLFAGGDADETSRRVAVTSEGMRIAF